MLAWTNYRIKNDDDDDKTFDEQNSAVTSVDS